MKIPEEKIQEVREASDIVEIIGQHVTLKKRGKTYLGLCPFHNEKTPSFNVDPVRHFYHCFGCNAGGNVFTFLMAMEKISFPEAVRQLARKANIALPEREENDEQYKAAELLYKANEVAAEFYITCLHGTKAGEKALKYFADRGFTEEMVKAFGIGYAPNAWEGMSKAAHKAGLPQAALLKAGLVIESSRGKAPYDRFRGRLMFPIYQASGRVVGFGGRLLAEAPKQPKYLNSPETLVYQKSRLVYGLFQAKQAIRENEQTLLVEGYTDVIRLHQAGIKNVVATSGTALTPDQAKLLRRYARRVVLIYDGDSAGLEAAARGAEVLIAGGLTVSIVALPAGNDPDSFVKTEGAEALQKLILTAQSFLDFRLGRLETAGRLKTPADRAEAARLLLGTLQQIPDAIERDLSVKALATRLDVNVQVLSRAVRTGSLPVTENRSEQAAAPSKPDGARQNAEKMLLHLLLDNGSHWADAIFHLVEPEHFEAGVHQTVARRIYDGYLEGHVPGLQTMLDAFQDNEAITRYLSTVMSAGLADDVDLSRLGLECARHLRMLDMKTSIDKTRRALKNAYGDEALAIHRDYAELKKKSLELPAELEAAWKKFVEI